MDAVFARTRQWAEHSDTVRRWRERRYALFMELCRVQPGERILDIGAGAGGALERFNTTNTIVAVDISARPDGWLDRSNVTVEQADATCLPYADRAFDVAFSSSVIQYVPRELQSVYAAEVRRVAGRYFVQTPNRGFPVDPHYQVPFIHWLPRWAQRALVRRFALGWRAKGEMQPMWPLSARGLRRLFPDAELHRERLFGLTKSLMIVGPKSH
jgi:SAM-dependent methyltransferase